MYVYIFFYLELLITYLYLSIIYLSICLYFPAIQIWFVNHSVDTVLSLAPVTQYQTCSIIYFYTRQDTTSDTAQQSGWYTKLVMLGDDKTFSIRMSQVLRYKSCPLQLNGLQVSLCQSSVFPPLYSIPMIAYSLLTSHIASRFTKASLHNSWTSKHINMFVSCSAFFKQGF